MTDGVRPREAPDHDLPDCVTCGACCRDVGDGTALVSAGDLVRWRREGRGDIIDGLVPGHFSQQGLPADARGHCLYLQQAPGRATCRIYPTRGEACRALEPGSPQCRAFRRAEGLS